MSNSIAFSEREAEIIRKRYPIVDLENLEMPPVGLSTISSLDYLESAVKFDITNSAESTELTGDLLSIAEKIKIHKEED